MLWYLLDTCRFWKKWGSKRVCIALYLIVRFSTKLCPAVLFSYKNGTGYSIWLFFPILLRACFYLPFVQDPRELLPVKLADFGFAKHVPKKNGCRTLCGTPGYLAPEILERWPAYDVKCDIWSVGVILFLLLGGYLPFDDEDEDKVFDRTRNGQYDFRPQFWRHISSGAKDLVTQCLTINPSKRIDATTALQHDWMAVEAAQLAGHQLDVDKLKNSMEAKRKLKAAVNAVGFQKEVLFPATSAVILRMDYLRPI